MPASIFWPRSRGPNPTAWRLRPAPAAMEYRIVADDSWRDIFSKILAAKIEPQLGHGRPTILMDYPASEAALAKLQDDPRFAERFELYACGVELANGFGELTDAPLSAAPLRGGNGGTAQDLRRGLSD